MSVEVTLEMSPEEQQAHKKLFPDKKLPFAEFEAKYQEAMAREAAGDVGEHAANVPPHGSIKSASAAKPSKPKRAKSASPAASAEASAGGKHSEPHARPVPKTKLEQEALAYDEFVDEQFEEHGLVIDDYQRPASYPPSASEPRRRWTGSAAIAAATAKPEVCLGIRYAEQTALDGELAELESLSQAVLAGDNKEIDKLRARLDELPHIWRRLADLQLLIEEQMAKLIASQDPLRLEAFRKRASELRHGLQHDSQSMSVGMAVSRVVACWTFVQFLELQVLQSQDLPAGVKQMLQAERRLESAWRSFALAKRLESQLAAQSK